MGSKQRSKNIVNDSIVKDISDAVAEISYGTVIITVHGRKITQIEVAHKRRFDDVWAIERGGA